MTQELIIDTAATKRSAETAEIIRRYNDVFRRHDPSALEELVAEDCVIENTTPAPDGARRTGKAACVELWSAIATGFGTRFDLEETYVAGDRATIRWRLWMSDGSSLRGVNLMRVADGRIVEAMGYVKG
ncbi:MULTISPECIES: nuclear transport factor 2 family protein [unclassified Mesorhizobium]|uniref:nuclear transport factor 2 family protein n=1 Tax=unclassified Mesorhizobium TaxID=325217 RepID=UPI000FE2F98A|nr:MULTISPECIES: nuclear transport factor 2 family protein [unclassified Mesorhizobium]MDG4895265.1 nuclear transport factor 2 family protein [Mesorhizobium sp. WSM4976]RWH68188.1 MAG: nuclear transport factor 2 family protein [Mesorhizobium sp.]RWL23852.1 MAG: nuclear transport factor 2 family protein [Mesorhizobium sp.]RWL27014.1 MAG: nuclear transport factor 2 family protein [Mesorhizobium sp.]RWL35453.1 MAG: nuclear transport factor 2 family protein [Mesorhizobium sp.]